MNIEKARKKMKMSRIELAEWLEIPYRTICSWEKGERECPKYTEKLIVEKILRGREVDNMKKERIIDQLKERGVDISKTNDIFRGIKQTENGVIVSRKADMCNDIIYFLQNDAGKIIPCQDRMMYVATGSEYEGKNISQEEAEQLAKEGKIYSFNAADIYAEYYDFPNNPELASCFKYGYSVSDRKYVEEIMKKVGLTHYDFIDEPESFEPEFSVTIYKDADIYVGMLSENEWIAQFHYNSNMDITNTVRMYFNHKPSENEVREAFKIYDFEMDSFRTRISN